MSYFYSATTGGFYRQEIHAKIPADAVEISDDDHLSLMEGQSAGKVISHDDGGRPILIDRSASKPASAK